MIGAVIRAAEAACAAAVLDEAASWKCDEYRAVGLRSGDVGDRRGRADLTVGTPCSTWVVHGGSETEPVDWRCNAEEDL